MHHLLIAAAVCLAGCGAHVRTDDGRAYVGDIIHSDAERITLADGERFEPDDPHGPPAATFQRLRIERARIEDIDHPGNVLMVVGGSQFAVGALITILALTADPPPEDEDDCVSPHGGPACLDPGEALFDGPEFGAAVGGITAAWGAVFFAIGAFQYFDSSRAAGSPSIAVGPNSLSVVGRF